MKNETLLLVFFLAVTTANAQLTIDHLIEARARLAATAAGGKVVFAGGWADGNINSNVVDILDTLTGQWSLAELSIARRQLTALSLGSKAYFFGGNNDISVRNEIDIYDASTDQWSTDTFPVSRSLPESVVSGAKIILAGGLVNRNPFIASDTVTIWDTSNNTWTGGKLSAPAYRPAICEVAGKVILSGGWNIDDTQGIYQLNDFVDILDVAAETWQRSTMPVAKTGQTGIGLNGKAYLIGGATPDSAATHSILVFDAAAGTWSEIFSPNPHSIAVAMVIGKKIFIAGGADISFANFNYFAGHDAVDVFDTETGEWESFLLTEPKFWGAGTGHGTKFYIGGGYDLASGLNSDVVNIYESPTSAIGHLTAQSLALGVWPNPFSEAGFWVDLPDPTLVLESYLLRSDGFRIAVKSGWNKAENLPPGAFSLIVKTHKGIAVRRCIKL